MESKPSRLIAKEFKTITNPHKKKNAKEENLFIINEIKSKNPDLNKGNDLFLKPDFDYLMHNDNFDKSELEDEEKRLKEYENEWEKDSDVTKAKRLLEQGLINSYIDFFYLYTRKVPNLLSKYQKSNGIEVSEAKPIPSVPYSKLTDLRIKLHLAERKYMKIKQYPIVINTYIDIRSTLLRENPESSLYFNQMAINIATTRMQMDHMIMALVHMGNCFQNPDDSEIRIRFLEQAKGLVPLINKSSASRVWIQR